MKTLTAEEYVKNWMNGYGEDTFIKNENGVVIYSAGPSSLNLTVFFEELLKDFIEDHAAQFRTPITEEEIENNATNEYSTQIERNAFIEGAKAMLQYFNGGQWISLDERLPELEAEVLLFDDWLTSNKEKRQDIRVGHLSEFTTRKKSDGVQYDFVWGGTNFAFNITHWMPLPSPPVTNNEEKK